MFSAFSAGPYSAAAAASQPIDSLVRRQYPWGSGPAPGPELANLDGFRGGAVDVGALPAGDSAWGVRGMMGNAWRGIHASSTIPETV